MFRSIVIILVSLALLSSCELNNSQKVLGIKGGGQLSQIPADYSAPKSSLEYLNTIYAERPILQGVLYQNYTQGAMVIADFNQDGTQELFSAHDPQEYVDFTFSPIEKN